MTNLQEKSVCCHCQQDVHIAARDEEGREFCCPGCLSVFHIIKENNLNQFYQYRENSGEASWQVPEYREENFSYLDSEQIHQDYIPGENGLKTLLFYLEGIHCIACLWLIEKLPQLVPGTHQAKVNLSKSTVEVQITDQGSFAEVANMLVRMGYFPHPVFKEDELAQFRLKEERTMLIRIGVAAASAMNIMLFAISLYGGATGPFANYFGYFCLALSLPVVFYSAWPFYQSSIAAIKSRHINIDVPLSLAIVSGFFISSVNVFRSSDLHYFDSITTLTFLILFSRYLLKKVQQGSLSVASLSQFFDRGDIKKIENGEIISIHKKYLKIGDCIQVDPGEMIPVDGEIVEGKSSLNTSALTGESGSVPAFPGSKVFAGTENIEVPLIVKVEALNEQTRMGRIFEKIERLHQNQAPIVRMTDRFSRVFLSSVLILASVMFVALLATQGMEIALTRTLSLIIITCPCALGLAIPLTFTRSIALAAKKGIIIKDESVIEKINSVPNLYLDKTGTITFGKYSVEKLEHLSAANNPYTNDEIIFTLEKYSKHPLAKAIRTYLLSQKALREIEINDYHEILGSGVFGIIGDKNYHLTGIEGDENNMSIGLFENETLISKITLSDNVREDSKSLINKIKSLGLNVYMLTGDKKINAKRIASKVDINPKNIYSDCNPEQKAEIIEKDPKSIMVGDGANDTLALKLASVGVAVQGSIDVGLKVSDVYFSKPGLSGVYQLLKLGRQTISTVHIILVFTALYNITGATLAIQGLIGPLQAAVLMPISSLIVTGISLYGTRNKEAN
jgi:Cu2+-exporting ATPase/Cu+-exporting ATPase